MSGRTGFLKRRLSEKKNTNPLSASLSLSRSAAAPAAPAHLWYQYAPPVVVVVVCVNENGEKSAGAPSPLSLSLPTPPHPTSPLVPSRSTKSYRNAGGPVDAFVAPSAPPTRRSVTSTTPSMMEVATWRMPCQWMEEG